MYMNKHTCIRAYKLVSTEKSIESTGRKAVRQTLRRKEADRYTVLYTKTQTDEFSNTRETDLCTDEQKRRRLPGQQTSLANLYRDNTSPYVTSPYVSSPDDTFM
jgi:hypothetical protein